MAKSMTWGLILFLCGCVLLKDGPAFSEDGTDVDCKSPVTQADMNQCASDSFRKADAELNAQWSKTRAVMLSWDKATPPDNDNGAAKRLLESQRAWLAYRDASCELEAYTAHGGSMEPLLNMSCMQQLTEKRVEELKSLAEFFAN